MSAVAVAAAAAVAAVGVVGIEKVVGNCFALSQAARSRAEVDTSHLYEHRTSHSR